jgi:DNA modification methylase
VTTHFGSCLNVLPTLTAQSVHTCVTSPPYWGLRDYGVNGQFGLEATPDEYVDNMVTVFRGVWRVLRDDGTLWLNLGDSYANTGKGGGGRQGNAWLDHGGKTTDCAGTFKYAPPGLKPKDLVGIPWRVAFALQADGWYLRSDIIWHKPNPMPESVTDRPTKAHEYIFLLSKSERYYYDADAIKEPADPSAKASWGGKKQARGFGSATGNEGNNADYTGAEKRNKRSVWTVSPQPYADAHFATFPPKLIEPCVLAGCPLGGTVLDPFMGSGTTAHVAQELGREWVGIELNEEYRSMQDNRTSQQVLPL